MKKIILLLLVVLFTTLGVNAQCTQSGSKSCCKSKTTTASTTSTNGGMSTLDLKVVGMHCSSCEGKVKTTLEGMNGVGEVKTVSATDNNAVLTYDPKKVSEAELVKSIAEKTGYAVTVNSSSEKCCKTGTKTCPSKSKSPEKKQ